MSLTMQAKHSPSHPSRMQKNKAYPIVRPLFYYYDVKNEGKVKPFIDYILSAEGQATVKQVGYIPVK